MTTNLKNKLHDLANDALNEQATIKDMETFKSVISMVHTLIQEGRVKHLQSAIHIHFPEYFTIPPPPIFSEN